MSAQHDKKAFDPLVERVRARLAEAGAPVPTNVVPVTVETRVTFETEVERDAALAALYALDDLDLWFDELITEVEMPNEILILENPAGWDE